MSEPLPIWIGFNAILLALLAVDLGFFSRGEQPASLRRLVLTTLGWIALAVAVGSAIGLHAGRARGLEFFTGYLIEYALSLDNIFLFVLIFTSFALTPERQRRVLFWGVLGALFMRGVLILAGVSLLQRFDWIFYLFGAYIVYAGINLFIPKPPHDVGQSFVVRLARRFLPLASAADSPTFVVTENGLRRFTTLFLVLIVVEATDLVFALDSIPAVFGVTTDPFIVYSSNACAVLGLRSLYFLLARAVAKLVYLQPGLGAVLVFIGAKMLLRTILPISTGLSLLVVGAILGTALVASLLAKSSTPSDAHS